MPDSLLIDAVGTCIAIDLDGLDPDDQQAVREAWAGAVHQDPDTVPAATVTPRGSNRAHLLSSLSQQVTLAAIDQRKGQCWMLHAAAVATEHGEVVVFVGPSGRGKTTAARALGQHYGYVSDETVAVDADGTVWPYRKPLSVIEQRGAPKTQLSPARLGLRPLPDATLSVAAIVLLERSEDAPDHPDVDTIDLGDAIADLVAQSSHLSRMSAPLQQIASIARATGGIRQVRYRDAKGLLDLVPALARSRVADPTPVPSHHVARSVDGAAGHDDAATYDEAAPRDAATSDDAAPRDDAAISDTSPETTPRPYSAGPTRYSRTEVADALELTDPDRLTLLTIDGSGRGTVRVLAGIAPELWRAAEAATLEQLTAAAVAAFGDPAAGDAESAVRTAIDDLCGAGLIRPTDRPDGTPMSGVAPTTDDVR